MFHGFESTSGHIRISYNSRVFEKVFRAWPSNLSLFQLLISGVAPPASHYSHATGFRSPSPLVLCLHQCPVLQGVPGGGVLPPSGTEGEKGTLALPLPKALDLVFLETSAA